jgi:hypothetical protein
MQLDEVENEEHNQNQENHCRAAQKEITQNETFASKHAQLRHVHILVSPNRLRIKIILNENEVRSTCPQSARHSSLYLDEVRD